MYSDAFIEVFIGIAGPYRGEVDYDQADAGAYPGLMCDAAGNIREKIHVVEAGGAAAQHFRDREFGAGLHEFFIDPFCLGRPYMVL